MKYLSIMAALILAASVWMALPTTSQGQGEGILVTATAYTCDNHPNNPMYPCGVLRWGGNVYSPGLACPVSWRGRWYEVPGYGTLKCDDTGAYDYWNGLPHIDIRVSTWAHAYNFGVRRMTIYPVGSGSSSGSSSSSSGSSGSSSSSSSSAAVQPTATPVPPTPTPEPLTTQKLALERAEELAPKGDSDTAMVRLLTVRTIHKQLPFLADELDLGLNELVWIVTLWQPESALPKGSKVHPELDGEIGAQLFVLDPESADVLANPFVTGEVLTKIGWLPSDQRTYSPD